MGKGEIARNEQFLLFPQGFQLNQIIVSPFVHIFDIISLFAAESEEHKIGISGLNSCNTWVTKWHNVWFFYTEVKMKIISVDSQDGE